MSGLEARERAVLRGEIARIIYENDDGSFAVLRIRETGSREYTARGALAGLAAGQEVELEGFWEQHAEFGRQFRAESFRIILPSTPDGIKRYLSSGAIPGIGKKTAGLIVDHFKEKTLDMLDGGASCLEQVPGIGPKKAEAVARVWRESAARRDSYIFMQGLGISPAFCSRLFKRYGEAAPQMVRTNPYRLAEEVDGIGFLKADEIARALGVARDAVPRLTAAAVFLYALVLLLALRPGTVRLRHALAAAVVVTGCCMALSCADAALPASSFAMLDVGQGQCLVSRTGGSVTVIDCGGAEDASGETAARYLLARGMPRVDRLILTHFDADHCNGVRQLLRRVQVDTLYIPELSPSSRLRTQILLAAAEAGTSIRYVTQDLVLPQEGGSLTIFAPTGEKDEENAGLCVLAACEKYDILITGDLTAQAEYRLLSLHTLPQASVLVAGHHGAATSTSGALLRAVRPEAVFISAGADNRFGHPAAQTLARIRQSGAAVYRTDLSGTITIRG